MVIFFYCSVERTKVNFNLNMNNFDNKLQIGLKFESIHTWIYKVT
jgi:hypothetical protein